MLPSGLSSRLKCFDSGKLKTSCTVDDYLACGGYATTRICIFKSIGEIVVKCFRLAGTKRDQEKTLVNFKREANVLVQLDHENIVKAYGFTTWKIYLAIVMEYAPNGDLHSFLENKLIYKIGWGLRLRMVKEIVSALAYLHFGNDHKTFCHCDLKPDNILIDQNLSMKVSDFGSTNLIRSGEFISTAAEVPRAKQYSLLYVAPEYDCNNPTPAQDMYSFSMIVYEVHTRVQVYKGGRDHPCLENEIKNGLRPKMSKVIHEQNKLRGTEKHISIHLKEVMIQCWDENSVDRPSSNKVLERLSTLFNSLAKTKHIDVKSEVKQVKTYLSHQPTKEKHRVALDQFEFPFKNTPCDLDHQYQKNFWYIVAFSILALAMVWGIFALFQIGYPSLKSNMMMREQTLNENGRQQPQLSDIFCLFEDNTTENDTEGKVLTNYELMMKVKENHQKNKKAIQRTDKDLEINDLLLEQLHKKIYSQALETFLSNRKSAEEKFNTIKILYDRLNNLELPAKIQKMYIARFQAIFATIQYDFQNMNEAYQHAKDAVNLMISNGLDTETHDCSLLANMYTILHNLFQTKKFADPFGNSFALAQNYLACASRAKNDTIQQKVAPKS